MTWQKNKRKALCRRERKCFYCDKPLFWKRKGHREKGTIDHFIPLADGGSNASDNLVLACKKCNNAKGCQSPADYLKSIDRADQIPEWMENV